MIHIVLNDLIDFEWFEWFRFVWLTQIDWNDCNWLEWFLLCHQVQSDGSRLSIPNIRDSNAGMYQCVATNNIGGSSKHFHVNVHSKLKKNNYYHCITMGTHIKFTSGIDPLALAAIAEAK